MFLPLPFFSILCFLHVIHLVNPSPPPFFIPFHSLSACLVPAIAVCMSTACLPPQSTQCWKHRSYLDSLICFASCLLYCCCWLLIHCQSAPTCNPQLYHTFFLQTSDFTTTPQCFSYPPDVSLSLSLSQLYLNLDQLALNKCKLFATSLSNLWSHWIETYLVSITDFTTRQDLLEIMLCTLISKKYDYLCPISYFICMKLKCISNSYYRTDIVLLFQWTFWKCHWVKTWSCFIIRLNKIKLTSNSLQD